MREQGAQPRVTVSQLRDYLASLPDELPVAVQGYEGGITVAHVYLRVVETKRNPDHDSYIGELEEVCPDSDAHDDLPPGPQVLLIARWSDDT